VDDAHFTVRAGEVVGFAGLMGSGRTELAMSLFGRSYGAYVDGKVFRDGQEVQLRTVREAIKHGVAYVTEDRKRFGLNLIGNIMSNISIAGLQQFSRRGFVDGPSEYRTAESYRTRMNIKTPNVSALVGKLSGGNQQKVVLSNWLNTGPEVLILDEPTRGIDIGAKHEIYEVINDLAASGKAIVVISSELPELLGLADRIYTISSGRITGEVAREDATQESLMTLMTAEKETHA
jgi:putative multiple sugar transport system ATP-binding protein